MVTTVYFKKVSTPLPRAHGLTRPRPAKSGVSTEAMLKPLLFWSLVAETALAVSTVEARAVCGEIFASIPDNLAFDPLGSDAAKNATSLNLTYTNTTRTYWNAANSADRPACIVYPTTAAHVSVAVQALRKYNSVPFSVKSGGHQFNRGWSSTDGGVLISFRPNLATIRLSDDCSVVEVGSGARWLEVISALDPLNKTVVGGRIGHVGVGGYTLGGGLSYLTSQYGFASDNVVNFEAVLANGTVINANATSNAELFWALRGGGNAFAIITKFTFRTHPIGNIWGGEVFYAPGNFPALFSAVTNFVAHNKDPKAAVIPTFILTGPVNMVNVATVFFFYDGAQPSNVFAEFDAIPALSDTRHTQRYPELLNITAAAESGLRTAISMQAFPNLRHDDMVAFLNWHWKRASDAAFLRSISSLDLQLFSMAIQPIPSLLQNASVAAGGEIGSPITPSPGARDKVWIEYDIEWMDAACDKSCPDALKTLIDEALAYQKPASTDQTSSPDDWEAYNPLFMNDAGPWQDVLGSYGADNYKRLMMIHDSVDPSGFFTTRQLGFGFQK